MINNNNYNNLNDRSNTLLNITASTIYPFKIMTQNIQGLNSKAKQDQLLQFLEFNRINIMGLSETKLRDKTGKFVFKNNSNYIAYFHNNKDNINSTGVGLIVSSDYARFITKTEGYKSRVIYLDLYL